MPQKQTKVVGNRKTNVPAGRPGRQAIRRKDSKIQDNMNDMGMEDEEIDQQNQGMKNQYEQLTAQELNEDMPSKMLEPKNPQAPKNITVYDYNLRKFKTDELVDQMIIHFSMDGDSIWKESNEYKTQEEIMETKKAMIKEAMRKQEREEPGIIQDEEAIKQTLRNKFNYNTRECQTINPSVRERGVSTEPPPSDTIVGAITQSEIFQAYMAEMLNVLEI